MKKVIFILFILISFSCAFAGGTGYFITIHNQTDQTLMVSAAKRQACKDWMLKDLAKNTVVFAKSQVTLYTENSGVLWGTARLDISYYGHNDYIEVWQYGHKHEAQNNISTDYFWFGDQKVYCGISTSSPDITTSIKVNDKTGGPFHTVEAHVYINNKNPSRNIRQ